MLQAIDVIMDAKRNGQTNAYIVLGRLKAEVGLDDWRARQILRDEGYEIDELVDVRFDTVSRSRDPGGFAGRIF